MSPIYYRARLVDDAKGFGQTKTPTESRSNGSSSTGSKYEGVAA